MTITRRTLFERSGMLALGSAVWPSWMPRMAFRKQDELPTGDIMVVVFARGGYDGLNMVIPYHDEADYFTLRPRIGIPAPDSNAGRKAFDLGGENGQQWGLHPTLAGAGQGGWGRWWDEGILAMAHAVAQDDPTRSHFDAMDYMERGTPGQKLRSDGWIGRHLYSVANANHSPFRAVGMGSQLQASLRGPVPAVALRSIAEFHLQGRQAEIDRFQQHLETLYGGDGWLDTQGQATFAALDLLQDAIANTNYTPSNGANYGQTGLGRGMMQIAQLVKAEVGLEVACIDIGGWDTHANQVAGDDPTTGGMANRMLELSQGISALITDLHDRFEPGSVKQGITIVVMSEFGRRAYENGGLGTDHGHGNVQFLFGRGINGGKVYTRRWPGLSSDNLDRGDLARTIEYRDVLGEVLVKRMGNAKVSEVFPGHTFNFLGLAKEDAGVPTPVPTERPTAVPKPTDVAPDRHEIYVPLVNRS
ncbi:MAG: DUF1501 domain-containing protein [Caldilineae bacterium]|nr:DUF1501 domain-containing protein [Chloroflexota bacterium]MCB9176272.1 DUF1501 domain-containing protein [Caldilineae bacterium]